MKKLMMIAMVAVFGLTTLAGDLRPLEFGGQAKYYGATHYVEVGPDLFADMATNDAYTAKFAVPAGTMVRLTAYECAMPFTGTEGLAMTNHVFGDATVAFGTEDAATALLAAKQCGTNTTVWFYRALPGVLTPADVDTNTATACTVSDFTTYAAATNLMITVSPGNGLHSLGWSKIGKARVFLDVRQPYGK
jgi:hypothetical protein